MSNGPGEYNDPDESPRDKELRERVDKLAREVQQVLQRMQAVSEMLEDRDHH